MSVIIQTGNGLVGKATLCDVSASGARVCSSLPIPIHALVLIQIAGAVRKRSSRRVTIEAQVIRMTDTGFAVEWSEFAPEAGRALWEPGVMNNAERPMQPEPGRLQTYC